MKKKNKYLDDEKVKKNIEDYKKGNIVPEVFYESGTYKNNKIKKTDPKKQKKIDTLTNSIILEYIMSIFLNIFSFLINVKEFSNVSKIYAYFHCTDYQTTKVIIIAKILLHILSIIMLIITINSINKSKTKSIKKYSIIGYLLLLIYIPRTVFIIITLAMLILKR